MRIRKAENPVSRAARLGLACLVLAALLMVPRPAAADSSSPAAWTPVPLPVAGPAGHWALAPGTTLHHLARTLDGTMYAASDGADRALFRSADSGLSWSLVKPLPAAAVALAASPVDPAVLWYATADTVYRSPDGGASFVTLPSSPGGSGQGNRRITSLAVTRAEGWVVAVGVADDDPAEYGGAWTMSETDGTFIWKDTGAGSLDVLAVAFSPDYPADRQLAAVATDGTDTFVAFRSGNLAWNALAGPATLHPDSTPMSLIASGASLAYAPNPTGPVVLYAAIATGTGGGDVYFVSTAPGPATALDLNAAWGDGLANADVAALGVSGSYPQVTVIAGAAAGTNVYTSRDAGTTWSASLKSPAGTSVTSLLPAPGAPGTTFFAATSGSGGGLSRSLDGGLAWDGIAFIDTAIDAIVDLAPSPRYEADGTLLLLTFGGGASSLWRTRDAGNAWERVLWSGAGGVTTLDRVGLPPDYGTDNHIVYAAGDASGTPCLWLSRDDGRTFDRRQTVDPATGVPFPIDAWALAGGDTVFIAGYNGAASYVYRTDNAGFYYAPGTAAGTQPIASLTVTADGPGLALVAGTSGGRAWLSRDSGATFQQLPPSGPTGLPLAAISVAFDANFSGNGAVYAAAVAAGSGVYRNRVNAGLGWEAVDTTLPAGGAVEQVTVSSEGVLYAVDAVTDKGLERSLEPARSNPSFATVTRGLAAGTALHGLWLSGTRVWSADTALNRLWQFDDTLTRAVGAALPADAAADYGTITNHAVTGVRLGWELLPGATAYEWQCHDTTSFDNLDPGMSGTTSGAAASLPSLVPGKTYYWRVRVSSPVPGPWSATRSFTTRLDTETVALLPDMPAAGATSVSPQPLFHWTAVVGADAYELVVAGNVDFAAPVIARTGEAALPTNAWASDVSLTPGTTYYWKVRALTAGAATAWSATGIFTTAEVIATESPLPTVTTTPAPDRSAAALPTATPSLQVFSPVTPTPTAGAPAPVVTAPSPAPLTALYQPGSVPAWLLYTVGGLLVAVVLILAVLLVVVLRLRAR